MPDQLDALRAAAQKAGAPDLQAEPEGADNEPDPKEGDEPSDRFEGKGNTDEIDDFPENFFGKNIKEFAEKHGVEAAKEYFDSLKDSDRTVNRRLQEIAELRTQAEKEAREAAAKQRLVVPEEAEPEAELSDEELLQSMGFDTGVLQYDDLAKPIVQLAKLAAAQQRQIEAMDETSQIATAQSQFDTQWNALEADHGKIPYDAQTIQEFAIERNIYDADALYWAIMGPINAQEPQAKDRTAAKRAVSNPRRRAASAGTTNSKSPKTLAEHMAEAKKAKGVTSDIFSF